MSRYTVEELTRALGGRYLDGEPVGEVRGISIDTRSLRPGELFVALKGPNHDGHTFLSQAFEAGAAGALIEDKSCLESLRADDPRVDVRRGAFLLLVADSLRGLQALAAYNRSRYPVPLVAVTGSNGKTTVKEMAASCLATVFRVVKNEASFNNHIGLPLTLARIDESHQVACTEMGMNHRGEIALLAALARPQVGVVTNVGRAHLEYLENLDGVQAAKGELIEALPPDGVAVLNGDDPRALALGDRARCRVISFGLGPGCDVSAEELEDRGLDGFSFGLVAGGRKVPVSLPVPGIHNVSNALAAAAAAWSLGVPLGAIAEGLSQAQLPKMRMERLKIGSWTIINDAYNANPDSTRAALETFVRLKGASAGAFCLGEMREIGPSSKEAHAEVGGLAARLGLDVLVAVGEVAAEAVRAARQAGMEKARTFEASDHEEAAQALERLVPPGAWILIKGSRGSAMERVVELLATEKEVG